MRTMRRQLVASVAVIAMFAAACGSGDDPADDGDATATSDEGDGDDMSDDDMTDDDMTDDEGDGGDAGEIATDVGVDEERHELVGRLALVTDGREHLELDAARHGQRHERRGRVPAPEVADRNQHDVDLGRLGLCGRRSTRVGERPQEARRGPGPS